MEKNLQNRKVHFYMDTSSSPFEQGQLTMIDPEFQAIKKVKIEEKFN